MNVNVDMQWNGEDVKIRGRNCMHKSALEIGLIVESQAKALAPKKTGRLQGSITTQPADGNGTRPQAPADQSDVISPPHEPGEVFVGTALEYAGWQEFGKKHMDAQPFLRPALELAKGKALTIVMHNGRYQFAEYLNDRA
jgi:HK97 gp10 family phage protein